METIKIYLENMFMNLPKSREVNRAKEELLTMMEDKYSELKSLGKTENEAVGIVISEFGNLEELAAELGISEFMGMEDNKDEKRVISLEEAKKYIEESIGFSIKLSIAIMLCICSPIALVVLGGMTQGEAPSIDEKTAGLIGVVVLFTMVAIAVGMLIFYGLKYEKYGFMKSESIRLEYGTDTYVREQKENYKLTFAIRIVVGVILCVFSVIPVIVAALAFEESVFTIAACVGILLAMVSVAVMLFITSGMRYESYKALLQEGEYEERYKKNNKLIETVASIYWPLAALIYIAWSFISKDWGYTWIIWPIAGVLFAVIANTCNAIGGNKAK